MRSLPRSSFLFIACALSCAAAASLRGQQPSAALRHADADYRSGVAALNSNDLKTAQERFESVVRLAPRLAQGYSALGAVLAREGRWPDAIQNLERALALNPGDDSARLYLAIAYQQTGANAKAVPLFARLEAEANARKAPLDPQLRIAYARALAATGRTEAAIRQMREVGARQASTATFHDDLGSLYAQQKDWPHAEEEFTRALQLQPDFAPAHLHLGFVLQAEQKGDAASEWVRACRLAPNDLSIALLAGKALADAGQDDQAAPILQQALRLNPRSIAAALQLALVLQRTNRVSESVDLLKKVVEAEPKNTTALVNLGLALSQLHRAQDALPYLQRAIALEPANLTAHQDLAAAYIQVDQVASAVRQLRAALTLAPNSSKAHYDLGVAYKLQDDAAHAIPQLEAAEKLDPSGYEAPYVLGLLYMQTARYAEAAPQLETSLKLHPQNGEGWSSLGSVYLNLNRLPEAANALREAIRELPMQSDPHLILATVLMKQNQVAEAVKERKIAAGLMRAHMNLQRAQVATNSGMSLLADGKVEDAIVEFRNALGFDPGFIEAHLDLADALQRQGKTAEAEAERAHAKALKDAANRDAKSAPATPQP